MRIMIENKVLIRISDEEKGLTSDYKSSAFKRQLTELYRSSGGSLTKERYINVSDFLKVIVNRYKRKVDSKVSTNNQ